MTPEEKAIQRLIVEIESELEHLAALRDEAAQAPHATGTFALRGRGSILHDFYGGIERVFRRIAEELEGGLPQGDQWHRQLLTDMSLEIPGVRTAVVSSDLVNRLDDYLRFRHLFRNVYGHVLEGERLARLEVRLPETHRLFEEELRAFLRWLEGAD